MYFPKQRILTVLLGLFIIVLALVYSVCQFDRNALTLGACLYLAALAFFTYRIRPKPEFTLRTGDLLIFFYLLYNLLLILFSPHPIDPVFWFEWFAIVSLYLIVRGVQDSRPVILFILVSVAIQALYGAGQAWDIFRSNHSHFSVTGSFSNPGPFGGYLAIGFILCLSIFGKTGRKWVNYAGGILLLLIGGALFLSDSRAAWLSVALSGLIYLITRIAGRTRRIVFCLLSVTVLSVLLIGLFQYKKKSAEARLLIWEVTLSSSGVNALTGKGPSSFPSQYMYMQAEYFEQNPDSEKACLAANNTHAFNDLLRIFYEQGLIGLIIFLFILGNALSTATCSDSSLLFQKLALVTWTIFSFFSYPSDVLPLKFMLPVLLGFLPGKKLILPILSPSIGYSIRSVFVFFLPVAFLLSLSMLVLNFRINRSIDDYYYESDERSAGKLRDSYPYYKRNKELILKYAKVVFTEGAYPDAVRALRQASGMSPSSLLLCDLGVSHIRTGQPGAAEQAFMTASRMTPCYMLPYYHLFLLYGLQGRIEDQVAMAVHLDEMVVKVENETTRRIRQEARQFLSSPSATHPG